MSAAIYAFPDGGGITSDDVLDLAVSTSPVAQDEFFALTELGFAAVDALDLGQHFRAALTIECLRRYRVETPVAIIANALDALRAAFVEKLAARLEAARAEARA